MFGMVLCKVNFSKFRQKKTPSRVSYLKKQSFSIEQKYDRFSQSSPIISTSCTLTPERSSHYRAHRLQSWQHNSDSGIQIDDSNSSCISASSFLNSDTSLGYETGEERFENLMQTNRAIFSCPRTPIPGKSAMKYNSDGGKNEYETLSGTLNIKRLSSPEIEADRNKSREVKDNWSIPDEVIFREAENVFHVYFLELSCSFSKFFRLDTCIRFGMRSLEKIALPMHTNLRTVIGLRQKDTFIVRSETIHLSHPRSTSPITTRFSKTVDLWKMADQKM